MIVSELLFCKGDYIYNALYDRFKFLSMAMMLQDRFK